MEYTLIRSERKTLSMEIDRDLRVVVRAPKRCRQAEIDSFVKKHERWAEEKLKAQRKRAEAHPEPSEAEREKLIARARAELPERVGKYAALMGLKPAHISITSAKKRYGSCSGKNWLCFSWRLMAYPDEAIDCVVVHELAHIVHKNHSPRFYALVEKYLPDYKKRQKMLRD